MALGRGFKAAAKEIAKQVKAEMKLSLTAPLDPWALAAHLEIPMIELSSIADLAPNAALHFSVINPSEFSAVTVFCGTRRVIVYNDSHLRGRQSSDITHEISHGLLLHTPHPALDANGCRNWAEDSEDEADWLGGVLLISDEGAMNIARQEMAVEEAADFYGVSKKMVEWRLRMSGAYKRVDRLRQFYKARMAS